MAKGPTSFIDGIINKINGGPSYLKDVLYCIPIGLLSGFILKNFGRIIFLTACAVIFFALVGNNFNFISLNTATIFKTFGLQSFTTLGDFRDFVIVWVTKHPACSFAFFVSFFVGWKLG